MEEKYLPIGSVVLLKGGKKKLMVTGYLPVTVQDANIVAFDYSGCLFPDGLLNSDQLAMFNHDQIEQIVFSGLKNEETEEFISKLNALNKNEVLQALKNEISDSNDENSGEVETL